MILLAAFGWKKFPDFVLKNRHFIPALSQFCKKKCKGDSSIQKIWARGEHFFGRPVVVVGCLPPVPFLPTYAFARNKYAIRYTVHSTLGL